MFGELLAPQYLRWLLDGFLLTLGLALLSCLLATLIGAPLAIARLSRRRLLSWPARAYLALFRNTPLLVQLFFWYFGVPALLPEALVSWLNTPHETPLLDWPSFEFLAGAWGLTLYTSAFVAEEFRAGIASVRPEQRAAGLALGLTQRQVWRVVVLPQALRTALPPLLGQYMNALKNSSLAMAIGLAELSYASRQVETETFKTFQAFGIATLLYIGAIALIEAFGQALQQTRRYRQEVPEMDFSVISDNLSYLLLGAYPDGPLGGAALTLLLASLSGLASAVLGLVLGVALAVLPGKPRLLLVALLGFFRAIPVLMLIFWTYFLLPIVFHVDVPALATVVCALSLIGGAYLAHSVYAGIHSLPAGQWAAARALGLRPWQVLRLVILPQALPVMLPSFLNQWVSLIKDTSLAYVIGVGELSFVATQVSNRVMVHPTEIFLFVALLYFLLCTSLDLAAAFLARRRRAERRPVAQASPRARA